MTLRNVPAAINRSARQVVLRHPNNFVCWVWRKRVTRTEFDPDTGQESMVGGMPTLGGMEVIRPEDESDFAYDRLGEARVLFGALLGKMEFVERGNAVEQDTLQDAQVECVLKPDEEGFFETTKGDLVLVTPGLNVVWAYSVEGVSSPTTIPGYIRNLMLQPRDDLHSLEPFLSGETPLLE